MSIKVMSLVWEASTQCGSNLLVLLALADWANDAGGSCFASIETIGEKARLSPRSVQYALRDLEESHEISSELRGHRNRSGQRTNEYTINVPLLRQLQTQKEAQDLHHIPEAVQPTAPHVVQPRAPNPSVISTNQSDDDDARTIARDVCLIALKRWGIEGVTAAVLADEYANWDQPVVVIDEECQAVLERWSATGGGKGGSRIKSPIGLSIQNLCQRASISLKAAIAAREKCQHP